jgi:3-oxoacyl-[acyl-carrier protein] reductase
MSWNASVKQPDKTIVAAAEIRARLEARFPSVVQFRVSEGMVSKFAALTGDQSALHVNEAFASRSLYRQTVVHGILPVAFLSLVEGFRIKGLMCSPTAISGRFVSPVYIGDRLSLRVELATEQPSASEVSFDYHIEKESSGTTVTAGSIAATFRNAQPGSAQRPRDAGVTAGLVAAPLPALCLGPGEISKGRSDGFDFEVSDGSIRSFVTLLAQGSNGAESPGGINGQGRFYYPNLLAITLFSTLVGTRLPGNSATFLEFSARLEGEIETGKPYRLQGIVAHMSRATRILKADVSVLGHRGQKSENVIQGKVTALVNPAHRIMPTIKDMKSAAADLGIRGKVALITGASRGIGETIAKLLALHGARVVVNYHRGRDDATRIVREIAAEGGEVIAVQADITRPEEVRKMVAEANDRYGPVDILINNAVRDFRPIPFLNLTWDEIQADLDVVARGTFYCCKEVIPQMLASGGGKIINISSVAVDNPPPDQAKYVLAKSALMGLTRSLSIEYAAKNIQVNQVVPNFVDTDLVAHVPEGFRGRIARETPMQRLGTPIEVAQAVVFLASSLSSFTTGQKIMVTGGGAPYL